MVLLAIPPIVEETPNPNAPPDWSSVFAEAGLDMAQFKPASPLWTPRHYADTRAAWERTSASSPDIERVEAGAYRGKVVFFQVVAAWSKKPDVRRTSPWWLMAFVIFWMVLMLVGGTWFALRNLRLGRGDRRAANRLAVCVLLSGMAVNITGVRHTAHEMEIRVFLTALSMTLLAAGAAWILYVALEPFVRRRSPQLLITWTRLFSGAFRDPLLGRDIAIGCLTGAVVALIHGVSHVAPTWAGFPGPPLDESALLNPNFSFLFPLWLLSISVAFSLATVLALTFFRLVLRKQWAAIGLLLVIVVAPNAGSANSPLWAALVSLLVWGIQLAVLSRWGITAFGVSRFIEAMLEKYPFTFDLSAWYAGIHYAGLALVLAVGVYGFYTALGGKPMFGAATLEE